MVLWVTRTQYCLLTLYWQKLHPSLQEVGTARGMRDERSYWPQTWHRENILVFASINKLPLHCTCNTKVIESNMFALKRTYLYSLLFKMHVWTTLQIVFAISYLGAKQEEAMYLEDGLGLSPPLLHQTVTDWASGRVVCLWCHLTVAPIASPPPSQASHDTQFRTISDKQTFNIIIIQLS